MSKITSRSETISDTNFRHVSIDEFRERVMLNPKIDRALKIKRSDLAKAVGFPPALIALELVMACRECYHSNRKIIDHDGRVLADFSTKLIGRTFGIPVFNKMEEVEKEFSNQVWQLDPIGCKQTIN